MFDGLITDGVIASYGTHFEISPISDSMDISVGTGRSWFNHVWSLNDTPMVLTLDPSSTYLDREDAIIIEVDSSKEIRNSFLKILKGSPGGSRIPMQSTDTLHQYPLAYITVKANSTAISASNIEVKVGSSECPFVTSILETVDIDNLFLQWQGEFDEFLKSLQDSLSGNVAANLQRQINELNESKLGKDDIPEIKESMHKSGDIVISVSGPPDETFVACDGSDFELSDPKYANIKDLDVIRNNLRIYKNHSNVTSDYRLIMNNSIIYLLCGKSSNYFYASTIEDLGIISAKSNAFGNLEVLINSRYICYIPRFSGNNKPSSQTLYLSAYKAQFLGNNISPIADYTDNTITINEYASETCVGSTPTIILDELSFKAIGFNNFILVFIMDLDGVVTCHYFNRTELEITESIQYFESYNGVSICDSRVEDGHCYKYENYILFSAMTKGNNHANLLVFKYDTNDSTIAVESYDVKSLLTSMYGVNATMYKICRSIIYGYNNYYLFYTISGGSYNYYVATNLVKNDDGTFKRNSWNSLNTEMTFKYIFFKKNILNFVKTTTQPHDIVFEPINKTSKSILLPIQLRTFYMGIIDYRSSNCNIQLLNVTDRYITLNICCQALKETFDTGIVYSVIVVYDLKKNSIVYQQPTNYFGYSLLNLSMATPDNIRLYGMSNVYFLASGINNTGTLPSIPNGYIKL